MAAWALGLLVMGIILVSLLALHWPDNNVSAPDPALLVVPSAHDLLPIAQEAARQWREDAYLTAIFVHLRPKLRAHFTFDSPSDPRVELGVDVESPLENPRLTPREASSESRTIVLLPIEAYAQSRVDSPEAYAIGLDAGGRSFALDHPEARLWYVSLQYVSDEIVAWRVVFFEPVFNGTSFEVVVDPVTGEVLDVKESN
jgi:hypothetical protein